MQINMFERFEVTMFNVFERYCGKVNFLNEPFHETQLLTYSVLEITWRLQEPLFS